MNKLSSNKLEGNYFRILDFTPIAKVEGWRESDVISPPIPNPYGLLRTECPHFENEVIISISHRLDFYNAWFVFNNYSHFIDFQDRLEVLVTHKPIKGILGSLFSSTQPMLEYSIFPKGQLEKIYNGEISENDIEKDRFAVLYGIDRPM